MSDKITIIEENIQKIIDVIIDVNISVDTLIDDCSEKKFNALRENFNDKNINEELSKIDTMIQDLLVSKTYEKEDMKGLICYLKITSELSKITNYTRTYCKNLGTICKYLANKDINKLIKKFHKLSNLALKILKNMINNDDADELQFYYGEIVLLENKTEDMYDTIKAKLCNHKEKGCDKNSEVLSVIRKSERTTTRVLDIALLLKAQ